MGSRYPFLDRLKIPHEIVHTDKLVKSLMRIAETKPFFDQYLGAPQEIKLLRKAKVRAITYSNQIEGNILGESEVTAILQGKRVAGPQKDIREVQNYHDALGYVEQLAEDSRPTKLADMCDIQKLVTKGLITEKYCGQVRSIPVSIVNATTGEKIEDCPQPYELDGLLQDLWRWLDDNKNTNPLTKAFSFHFIAVSIHPFADGNGRTVRLMQHLLLLQANQKFAKFVPSETVIMRNRERYYSNIRLSRKLESLYPILEFLAECFAQSAEEIAQEDRSPLKKRVGKKPEDRYQKILEHAKKYNEFSIQDVIKWLPEVPRRTLERDISTLIKKRVLKSKGESKSRIYSLANPMKRRLN